MGKVAVEHKLNFNERSFSFDPTPFLSERFESEAFYILVRCWLIALGEGSNFSKIYCQVCYSAFAYCCLTNFLKSEGLHWLSAYLILSSIPHPPTSIAPQLTTSAQSARWFSSRHWRR